MRAAFYEKDITPPLGGYLAGMFINYSAEDVLDTLHVRSAVIESMGNMAAIIEIDSCEFPDDLHDAVTARIFEYTGINAENVLVAVNHTHKGIPIIDSPEINAFADKTYKDTVYRLIADCVILAYKRLHDAEGFYACGTAEGIAFNRTFVMSDGTYRTNAYSGDMLRPLGKVDESVPILFFKDGSGKPCGAIVSFACHQDCTPGASYSGAFSHVLSDEMKKEYGDEFVTVFLAGTSGDINHIDPKYGMNMPWDTYVKMGKTLKAACVKALSNAEPTGEGLFSRKELTELPRRILTDDEAISEIKRMADEKDITAIRNLCYYQACVKGSTAKYYLQYIKIGNTAIYAYPGEIFVYFGLYIKEYSETVNNMVCSFSNGGCGYVATREAYAENSRLYEKNLSIGACLAPEAGYMMTERLLEMAKEVENEHNKYND